MRSWRLDVFSQGQRRCVDDQRRDRRASTGSVIWTTCGLDPHVLQKLIIREECGGSPCGDLPFVETDFEFPDGGGSQSDTEDPGTQSLVIIPGKNHRKAVIMADTTNRLHGGHLYKERGGRLRG